MISRSSVADREALSPPSRLAPVEVSPGAGQTDLAAWSGYLEHAPEASVFHHPDWCGVVERIFGHRPLHLLAWRGSRLVGVLPLMEVDSLLGGRMHVSVPYGTYGGILADDAQVVSALASAAEQQADRRGASVLELRSARAMIPGWPTVDGYLGFIRQLPARPEEVAGFLPKRARAAARHARDRDGLVVEHNPGLAPTVWKLYCRGMRRLGSINYPYRLFAELIQRWGSQVWVSVAWLKRRPVAGTICLLFGDTIMPYILGADERVRCDGAANLLYWSIMERAVQCGLRRFDYGRSRADNPGAVGFKKNQGFEPQPLGYQRYVPAGRQPPNLRPSNPRFGLARRVWRRLPLAVCRPLGAWLARSIPG